MKLAFQFSSSNPRTPRTRPHACWYAHHPGSGSGSVHTCLVGSTSLDMLDANVRWMNQPMDEDLLAMVPPILSS